MHQHVMSVGDSLNILCSGHPDDHFIELAGSKFLSVDGTVQAYVILGSNYAVQLNGTTYPSTVRSQILVPGAFSVPVVCLI